MNIWIKALELKGNRNLWLEVPECYYEHVNLRRFFGATFYSAEFVFDVEKDKWVGINYYGVS